ncbi:response regulator transcription factor [Myxococcota bacterium]|nr:response regulator transcription factor [Myxococcota bacterium]MBU1538078.1 response regulator transcription factor [Myxococcota bacterium]
MQVSEEHPIRVFLIEDEPDIRRQQERLLQKQKTISIIGSAGTGEEGIQMLQSLEVDVVLLDLGLPGMNGIEVTRELKKLKPSMEIIIFTIFDEENRVLAAIQAGASGYLLKGMGADRMIDAIHEVAAGGSVIQPHLARHILRKFRESLPVPGTSSVSEDDTPVESPLTPREQEILTFIAKGLSNKEAAKVLSVSVATVRTHLEHIYAKLDVTNRTEAVTEGIRKGFIPLN